ncbi:hypothetical protein [Undibacterium griseum]|nr:hypothetical protein [Undibacterium griseum]
MNKHGDGSLACRRTGAETGAGLAAELIVPVLAQVCCTGHPVR